MRDENAEKLWERISRIERIWSAARWPCVIKKLSLLTVLRKQFRLANEKIHSLSANIPVQYTVSKLGGYGFHYNLFVFLIDSTFSSVVIYYSLPKTASESEFIQPKCVDCWRLYLYRMNAIYLLKYIYVCIT